MANDKLTFFGGTETTAEDFALALSTRAVSVVEYMAGDTGAAMEIKKAFDALKVNIIGRPQRPRDDIYSLLNWHRRNELVYACIEKIAQAAQDPSLIVEKRTGADTWDTVKGHPLRQLMMFPNALDDEASFVGAWLASKHIAGRFFAEIVTENGQPGGRPIALWPLHPGKVFPIPGKGKDGSNIVGWKWKDSYLEQDFTPEEILYDRNRDLGNYFDAISPLAVALNAVDSDTAQTEYVRAFFNNGGVPSGILRFNNRNLNRAEAEQKRQMWNLRYGRRGLGERGIAVLDQQAEYQKIGSDIKELEADSLRGQAEARICMVFGVPPLLVGAYVGLMHVNQRASAREAQQDFWINKMSPTFKALRSFITRNLLGRFENPELIKAEQVRANWDMSQVLALQEDKDKESARALNEFRGGLITQNEGRESVGRERSPDGDFFLIPSSFNPRTGEVLLSIAQQEPTAPPAPGDPNDPNNPALPDKTPPKALTGAEADFFERLAGALNERKAKWQLPPAPEEGKAIERDGIKLKREPKIWEAHLDLKAIAEAPSKPAARIKSILLGLRKGLIKQAVDALSERDPSDLHSVVLVTPPPKTYKSIREQLTAAYRLGQSLIDSEAARLKPKSTFTPKDFKELDIDSEDDDFLEEVTGTTIARVVNEVQSKAAGVLATLSLLQVTGADRRSRIKSTLDESSTAYMEQAASNAASVAINVGRDAEIEARSDEWGRVIYSAILDVNTCDVCESADGEEAKSVEDLPPAPNDECEGGDKCRCFHVAVFDESDTPAAGGDSSED